MLINQNHFLAIYEVNWVYFDIGKDAFKIFPFNGLLVPIKGVKDLSKEVPYILACQKAAKLSY